MEIRRGQVSLLLFILESTESKSALYEKTSYIFTYYRLRPRRSLLKSGNINSISIWTFAVAYFVQLMLKLSGVYTT